MKTFRPCLAEFLGTFYLCFAGFSAILSNTPAVGGTSGLLGIPLPAPWASTGVVLVAEFVVTFLLMTSIFGTAVDERGKVVKIGGFGVGLTVAFDILAGGPITGASMNPARSFGPALIYEHVLLGGTKTQGR